jgi:hypothetical protein
MTRPSKQPVAVTRRHLRLRLDHGHSGWAAGRDRRARLETPGDLLGLGQGIERPKLSDPAHEGVRLQPRRDGRVRCSAWLGVRSLSGE